MAIIVQILVAIAMMNGNFDRKEDSWLFQLFLPHNVIVYEDGTYTTIIENMDRNIHDPR